jgi:PAS domain S-box-containing protein
MDTIIEQFQNEKLTDFIADSPIPINLINGSGIIIWANQEELDFLGYREEEYIGKHLSNFHASNEMLETIISKQLKNEKVVNCPAKVLRKDGQVRDVLINSNVLWEKSRFIHARSYMTDVTSLKKELRGYHEKIEALNERAKQTEQLYNRMIMEIQDYAIIMMDLDGTILNWNKGAERIKGYKDHEIIGQNFRIFYLPQDRQEGLPEKLIMEAIKNGRALHEGLRVRKNGTKFWGTIVITAIHNDEGEVIGFAKVTRDLTDHENNGNPEKRKF